MQLILEVKTGPLAGKKIRLTAPQVQTVGRTEKADFVVDSDVQMSGVHFAVHCQVDGCQLRDLDSSNGTFLNEQSIQAADLHDGDQIRTGDTVFGVEMHGSPPPERRRIKVASALPANHVGLSTGHHAEAPTARQNSLRYRMYPCHSQLHFLLGTSTTFDVAEIAVQLAEQAPMYVVLGGSQANTPAEPSSVAKEPVFDWPLEAGAEMSSPILIGPDRDALCRSLADSWGQNSVVCLFDRRPHDVLLAQLREFARPRYAQFETRELACLQPMALIEFLTNGDPRAVAAMAVGVEAIFVEAYQGDRWAVFGNPQNDLPAALKPLGFVEAPAWERV